MRRRRERQHDAQQDRVAGRAVDAGRLDERMRDGAEEAREQEHGERRQEPGVDEDDPVVRARQPQPGEQQEERQDEHHRGMTMSAVTIASSRASGRGSACARTRRPPARDDQRATRAPRRLARTMLLSSHVPEAAAPHRLLHVRQRGHRRETDLVERVVGLGLQRRHDDEGARQQDQDDRDEEDDLLDHRARRRTPTAQAHAAVGVADGTDVMPAPRPGATGPGPGTEAR